MATLLCIMPAAPIASAHHSAALFYDMGARISLKGEVIRWNFRNPHAILELDVKNARGETEQWTCETSAPSAVSPGPTARRSAPPAGRTTDEQAARTRRVAVLCHHGGDGPRRNGSFRLLAHRLRACSLVVGTTHIGSATFLNNGSITATTCTCWSASA
jgi:hypothetical protein